MCVLYFLEYHQVSSDFYHCTFMCFKLPYTVLGVLYLIQPFPGPPGNLIDLFSISSNILKNNIRKVLASGK